MPAPQSKFAEQAIDYFSQSIPPGEVRIDIDPNRVQILMGPLNEKGWIAALLPGIGSVIAGAALFIIDNRGSSFTVADLIMPLFIVGSAAWGLYVVISTFGRSRSIVINKDTIQIGVVGMNSEPMPVTEMMCIRAQRIWWAPMTWSLVADGYPKWWRRRLGIPSVGKDKSLTDSVILVFGQRDTVMKAAAAMQLFVRGRQSPRVWGWVPWTIAGTMVCFGSAAVWSVYASLHSSTGHMIAHVCLSAIPIVMFFAVPIVMAIAIDKGRFRQPDGRPVHRNNAAEWAMVFALMPIVWVARVWPKSRRRQSGKIEVHGEK